MKQLNNSNSIHSNEHTTVSWPLRTIVACTALLVLGACQRSAPAPATEATAKEPVAAVAEAEANPNAPVTLQQQDIVHMGITTASAAATSYAPEKEGYGVVLGHDAIAQAVADVSTAEAAAQQSRAALARVQRLAGTPGAMPVENTEAATRQAAADAAALALAQRRLSASLGQNPPWKSNSDTASLSEIASGKIKLVRVTFPLGVLRGKAPQNLRMAHLDASNATDSFKVTQVWDAPADPSVPGRSFFAMLAAGDIGEGEHVQVWAASGNAEQGVAVPAAAVVISDGKYWCYVEKPAGTFTRVAIDTSRPMTNSYFVKEGVTLGDAIVVTGSGLLLARQSNSSTEAE